MSFWDLIPWLGGTSVVAVIAVAILAPSILQVAGNWLSAMSPAIKGIAEFLVEAAKSLWAGFLDMTDNGRSILFVAVVAVLAYAYGYYHGVPDRKEVVTRTVYKDCSTPTRRPPPPKRKPSDPLSDFFDGIFGPSY